VIVLFSWAGLILGVIGAVLAAHKRNACWIVWLFANASWSIYAVATRQWALLLMEVVFVISNVYGIVKWSKDGPA
jgi:nicotinamide riboside transporter PnuC